MGDPPPGGALHPNVAPGDLPCWPPGRRGDPNPNLRAAEEMPGGKYLLAPTSAVPNTQVDGRDLQG